MDKSSSLVIWQTCLREPSIISQISKLHNMGRRLDFTLDFTIFWDSKTVLKKIQASKTLKFIKNLSLKLQDFKISDKFHKSCQILRTILHPFMCMSMFFFLINFSIVSIIGLYTRVKIFLHQHHQSPQYSIMQWFIHCSTWPYMVPYGIKERLMQMLQTHTTVLFQPWLTTGEGSGMMVLVVIQTLCFHLVLSR